MKSRRAEPTVCVLDVTPEADLFAVDEQREAVEQLVDGVARLVDGQDDGAAAAPHPERQGQA